MNNATKRDTKGKSERNSGLFDAQKRPNAPIKTDQAICFICHAVVMETETETIEGAQGMDITVCKKHLQ